jgi:hypothetical protein
LAAIGASSLLFFLVAMRMCAPSQMPGSNKSGARSHWPDSHADQGSNPGPAD